MNKKVIMIIDDSQFSINRTMDAIKKVTNDFDLQSSKVPSEVVEKILLKKEIIDYLIIDQSMPKLNGLDFIDRVKKLIPASSIMLLSASAGFATGLFHVPEGIHFVEKPVSSEKIEPIIKMWSTSSKKL
ncbi:MAG: response regulator [Oligoflexia bacterium]|nr:response regulator [Oligoflexia bacterium]